MEKDKFVGICKVGEKGQIVIPAQAKCLILIQGIQLLYFVIKKKELH